MYMDVCLSFPMHEHKCVFEIERDGGTAALIWSCLLSTRSRNVSRGNTWREGKMGEDMHTYTHTHTPLMCEGSLGSQSAALNKAFLFLPLIAGSICHWGVQFLISALTESGDVGVGKNTKWMHLLTNEIKPLHLHFPFFRQLEQCCRALALRTLSYFLLTMEKAG